MMKDEAAEYDHRLYKYATEGDHAGSPILPGEEHYA